MLGVAVPRFAQTDPRCSLAPLGVAHMGATRAVSWFAGSDGTLRLTRAARVAGSCEGRLAERGYRGRIAERVLRPAGEMRRAAPLRHEGCADGPAQVVAAGLHAPDLGQRMPARPARLPVGSIGHGGRGRARARTGQRAVGHTISESAHKPARPPTHRRWDPRRSGPSTDYRDPPSAGGVRRARWRSWTRAHATGRRRSETQHVATLQSLQIGDFARVI